MGNQKNLCQLPYVANIDSENIGITYNSITLFFSFPSMLVRGLNAAIPEFEQRAISRDIHTLLHVCLIEGRLGM